MRVLILLLLLAVSGWGYDITDSVWVRSISDTIRYSPTVKETWSVGLSSPTLEIPLKPSLPMKVDTVKIDTIGFKCDTLLVEVECPDYKPGDIWHCDVLHMGTKIIWYPELRYITDTTYYLTKEQIDILENCCRKKSRLPEYK